jgi:capsular exopolysaccharide synthesis family protein
MVLVAVVFCGTAALVAAVVQPPRYATSLTFFVTTPSEGITDAYQGGLFSAQRAKSYVDLLTGERLATSIAADKAIGLTPAEVQAELSGESVQDTVLLQATVTDRSPARSQLIAHDLATQFVTLIQGLETPTGQTTSTVKVEVVAGPTFDPTPVSPRPLRNLALGIVLGLLLGLGAAVLREVLDVTIKTATRLQDVTKAPVLATIPFDPTARRRPLAIDADTHSARAEAFRHLRTNLQFVDVDEPLRVVLVTSAVPDEGKSTTAVNLAIAFANAGNSVLLIEGDMRRPRVADYLGLEGAVGLSNVLAGLVECDAALQPWGPYEFWVLPAGFLPPNPSELLGSRNMARLLEEQRERFDIVILDSPPLLPVTDAAVVAAYADGAVLVTRAGKTAHTRVSAAVASLRAVDSRLVGCVLTMARTTRRAGYYGYSYYRSAAGPALTVPSGQPRAAAIDVEPPTVPINGVAAALTGDSGELTPAEPAAGPLGGDAAPDQRAGDARRSGGPAHAAGFDGPAHAAGSDGPAHAAGEDSVRVPR